MGILEKGQSLKSVFFRKDKTENEHFWGKKEAYSKSILCFVHLQKNAF